jgi:hypothetical protein
MIVAELIKRLQEMPQGAPVKIIRDDGSDRSVTAVEEFTWADGTKQVELYV